MCGDNTFWGRSSRPRGKGAEEKGHGLLLECNCGWNWGCSQVRDAGHRGQIQKGFSVKLSNSIVIRKAMGNQQEKGDFPKPLWWEAKKWTEMLTKSRQCPRNFFHVVMFPGCNSSIKNGLNQGRPQPQGISEMGSMRGQ